GGGALPNEARAGRSGPRPSPKHLGCREAATGPEGRRPRPPRQARKRLLPPTQGSRLPAAEDQPPRRWSPRRLLLGRPAADCRAPQLHVPPFTVRVGAGPPPRARSARPGGTSSAATRGETPS